MSKSPKLLDQVRECIRVKHYSIRTENTYVDWIKRFILFHHKRQPKEIGSSEVEAFLTYLDVERNVPASIQEQATRRPYTPELSAHCPFYPLQHHQNRFPRRPNIQPHKPAAFRPKLHAGVEAHTGFVDEEVFQLRVGHVPFATVEPQQVGAFGLDHVHVRQMFRDEVFDAGAGVLQVIQQCSEPGFAIAVGSFESGDAERVGGADVELVEDVRDGVAHGFIRDDQRG